MTDLTGIGLKLSRAEDHLNRLRTILVGEHDAELRGEYDAGQEGYNIYREGNLDLRLGILVGDLVHNARSSLDHLVAALLTSSGKRVRRHHAFPVYATEAAFIDNVWSRPAERGPDCLDGLTTDERASVRDLQPYIGRNRDEAERTPLYKLHACWNLDKHRLVQVGSTYAAEGDVHFAVEPAPLFLKRIQLYFAPGTVLPPGAKVAFVQIGVEPGAEHPGRADLQLKMTLSVAFGESGKLPLASMFDLTQMIKEVTKIVRVFEPDFLVPIWTDPVV
jgi:hypothetical protein